MLSKLSEIILKNSSLTLPSLRWFKLKFGHLPDEIFGDRGLFCRWIAKCINKLFVKVSIQRRGKTKTIVPSRVHRREIRKRLPIEARISLAKRKFGWDRCRAKNPDHEENWICLQAAAMNVHLAFGCRPP